MDLVSRILDERSLTCKYQKALFLLKIRGKNSLCLFWLMVTPGITMVPAHLHLQVAQSLVFL